MGELVLALLAVLPAPDRARTMIQLKDHADIVAEVPGSASSEQVSLLLRSLRSRRVTQVYVADVEEATTLAELPLRPAMIPSEREDV
jgi:hypothetical protein